MDVAYLGNVFVFFFFTYSGFENNVHDRGLNFYEHFSILGPLEQKCKSFTTSVH